MTSTPVVQHRQQPDPSNKIVAATAEKAPIKLPPSASDPKQATDELNWSELAYELDLTAVARQLVLNSVVISWRNSELKLAFLPELEVMLNRDLERQIKEAIEGKLGVSLSLMFSSQPVLDAETPQQAYERKQEQARQQVIVKIQQDPVVQQLNALFGAELVEQSVRKNDTKRAQRGGAG